MLVHAHCRRRVGSREERRLKIIKNIYSGGVLLLFLKNTYECVLYYSSRAHGLLLLQSDLGRAV